MESGRALLARIEGSWTIKEVETSFSVMMKQRGTDMMKATETRVGISI